MVSLAPMADRPDSGSEEKRTAAAAAQCDRCRLRPAGMLADPLAEHRQIRLPLRRIFPLDAFVDFLAVNRDMLRRLDSDPYLAVSYRADGDLDIVPDNERLSHSPRQDEHVSPL